nr:hypothetical protein [Tanacetum cinerariifolium]
SHGVVCLDFLQLVSEPWSGLLRFVFGLIKADLSEMELKKILIEKMEGNKSIQRSDEQRNLYKALVEAYEADKAILDTCGDSDILKRRREDDDPEGPSAGPNRGSKRQKEGAGRAVFQARSGDGGLLGWENHSGC